MVRVVAWIVAVAVCGAGIAAWRERWGAAVLWIVAGALLVGVVEDPGSTIVPVATELRELVGEVSRSAMSSVMEAIP